jgi:hypothetical protein
MVDGLMGVVVWREREGVSVSVFLSVEVTLLELIMLGLDVDANVVDSKSRPLGCGVLFISVIRKVPGW